MEPTKKLKGRPESMGGDVIGQPYEVDIRDITSLDLTQMPNAVLDQLHDDLEE